MYLCGMGCCDEFHFVSGNLITKGGALGYVRSSELSAPFLHPLFSLPLPLPSVFPRYYSIQTVLLVLCLQMPGGELWRGCFSIHCFIWRRVKYILYPSHRSALTDWCTITPWNRYLPLTLRHAIRYLLDLDRRLLNKCIFLSRLRRLNEINTDSECWISFFFSLSTNATQKDKVTVVFSSWIGCTVYHVTKVFWTREE